VYIDARDFNLRVSAKTFICMLSRCVCVLSRCVCVFKRMRMCRCMCSYVQYAHVQVFAYVYVHVYDLNLRLSREILTCVLSRCICVLMCIRICTCM